MNQSIIKTPFVTTHKEYGPSKNWKQQSWTKYLARISDTKKTLPPPLLQCCCFWRKKNYWKWLCLASSIPTTYFSSKLNIVMGGGGLDRLGERGLSFEMLEKSEKLWKDQLKSVWYTLARYSTIWIIANILWPELRNLPHKTRRQVWDTWHAPCSWCKDTCKGTEAQ